MYAVCQSFFAKWVKLKERNGFSFDGLDWTLLMLSTDFGMATSAAAIYKELAGQATVPLSANDIKVVFDTMFQRGQVNDQITLDEAEFIAKLFAKLPYSASIPENVFVSCVTLQAIADTAPENLTDALTPFEEEEGSDNGEGSSDFVEESENDDSDDEDGVPVPVPLGGGRLGGLGGGGLGGLGGINLTGQPGINLGGGVGAGSTVTPNILNTFNVGGTGTLIRPPPAPSSNAPSFTPGGGGAFGGGVQGAQQTDLAYVTVAVRNLPEFVESKIYLISVPAPTPNNPQGRFAIELFVTPGKVPEPLIATKFAYVGEGKSDNSQKSTIHHQNEDTLKVTSMFRLQKKALSNGIDPAGVCAQRLEMYNAQLMTTDVVSGQPMEPIIELPCAPPANRVPSLIRSQPPSGQRAFEVAGAPTVVSTTTINTDAITSGGLPFSETVYSRFAPIVLEAEGQVPPGAAPVRIYQFVDDPLKSPGYLTWSNPNGPVLIAYGGTGSKDKYYYWFKDGKGKVGKSKSQFPVANDLGYRHGTNQNAIIKILLNLPILTGEQAKAQEGALTGVPPSQPSGKRGPTAIPLGTQTGQASGGRPIDNIANLLNQLPGGQPQTAVNLGGQSVPQGRGGGGGFNVLDTRLNLPPGSTVQTNAPVNPLLNQPQTVVNPLTGQPQPSIRVGGQTGPGFILPGGTTIVQGGRPQTVINPLTGQPQVQQPAVNPMEALLFTQTSGRRGGPTARPL